MRIQRDFEELLALLEANRVEYMIVGGYAVAFHGFVRFTKDIDIFYALTTANVKRLRTALAKFGFPEKDLPVELFTTKGNIITFGEAPVRVDLLNRIAGVTFARAKRHAVRGCYGKTEVTFVGRVDLIRNKRATGRPRDQLDAGELE